jgi:hypothetical protein
MRPKRSKPLNSQRGKGVFVAILPHLTSESVLRVPQRDELPYTRSAANAMLPGTGKNSQKSLRSKKTKGADRTELSVLRRRGTS